MSFFSSANQDAFSIDPAEGATGPRVGFLDAFETSYNAQVRGSAMYGIEKAFHEADAEQVENLRKAGVEDIPHMSDDAFGFLGSGAFSGEYMDVARFYQDGGDPELAQRVGEYDRKVGELQKRFPDLRLRKSREIWDGIRQTAQEYEQRASLDRNTWLGTVGGFMGGMAGGLNIESDPFNFATIPLGTIGKSILGRVAGQAAGQGAIETINQLTGVQEQRRLLGLSHGFADGLSRVGGAAIGGAAFQGLGEAVAFGARRFFRNAPLDPAPPAPEPRAPVPTQREVPNTVIPADEEVAAAKLATQPETYVNYVQEVSPLSTTRAGRARTVLDVDYVKTQLDDWAGPTPSAMRPKTDTAVNLPRNDFVSPAPTIFDRVAQTADYDTLARQIDPETFRVYDKLADENNTYRRWLTELGDKREGVADARVRELNDRIDDLQDKINRSGKMKGKKYGAELNQLVAERERVKAETLSTDTKDMAIVRGKMMRNDEKMRDMSPVISRAYARARNKWDNTDADRQAIQAMIRDGRKNADLPDAPNVGTFEDMQKSLYEKAPVLQQRAKAEQSVQPDDDAATIAMKIMAQNAKEAETVLERYRATVSQIIGDLDKPAAERKSVEEGVDPNELTVPGVKTPLNLDDKVMVPTVDGTGYKEVSIRTLLKEQNDVEEDLKAVTSCSIR